MVFTLKPTDGAALLSQLNSRSDISAEMCGLKPLTPPRIWGLSPLPASRLVALIFQPLLIAFPTG